MQKLGNVDSRFSMLYGRSIGLQQVPCASSPAVLYIRPIRWRNVALLFFGGLI